jgi:hypothetical protein
MLIGWKFGLRVVSNDLKTKPGEGLKRSHGFVSKIDASAHGRLKAMP